MVNHNVSPLNWQFWMIIIHVLLFKELLYYINYMCYYDNQLIVQLIIDKPTACSAFHNGCIQLLWRIISGGRSLRVRWWCR